MLLRKSDELTRNKYKRKLIDYTIEIKKERLSMEEYLYKTIKNDRCTAKIYRPVLSEEEAERRMEDFKKATAEFVLRAEAESRKKKKERETA